MAKGYEDLSDEEIISCIRSGEKDAIDFIMEKYKHMVRTKARKLFLIGADKDDLIQEGMIGLYKAIRDFDQTRDSSFGSFADLCIARQMYDAIKASNRKKNIPLNTYVSFYAPVYNGSHEGEDRDSMVDLFFADNKENPEDLMIDKENAKVLEQKLIQSLSGFEREVIKLYLRGNKYTEIARTLGREPKSIDNALQRIKGKLTKVLKELHL